MNTQQTVVRHPQPAGQSPWSLKQQNSRFQGSGGVSKDNRSLGFSPAFQDSRTGRVYLSRFANGSLAPMHILDGLPASLVLQRTVSGQVLKTIETLIAGFVREGSFYTREQAARAVSVSG